MPPVPFNTDAVLKEVREKMQKAVDYLDAELKGIRTGRATPGLVEHIRVEVYGSGQPLKNVAQISTPDARTIAIKPFDGSTLKDIERGIAASDLGVMPNSDGKTIRINLPPLTEERRKQLVAHVKSICEQQRVQLRNARRDYLKKVESALAEKTVTEDARTKFDKQVNDLHKDMEKRIDDLFKKKSEEIMQI
jgi:ribosome recycling factor